MLRGEVDEMRAILVCTSVSISMFLPLNGRDPGLTTQMQE